MVINWETYGFYNATLLLRLLLSENFPFCKTKSKLYMSNLKFQILFLNFSVTFTPFIFKTSSKKKTKSLFEISIKRSGWIFIQGYNLVGHLLEKRIQK